MNSNNVFLEYGDGRGENNAAYRRGKTASFLQPYDRWIHVAAVVNSASSIELYANGQNVGGNLTGNTTLPMASDFPNDVAKIGVLNTNSFNHHFKGQIDEVVLYKRALSEVEIREGMCRRLRGDELGLIGYWTFDETSGTTLTDKSLNSFDGELKGGTHVPFLAHRSAMKVHFCIQVVGLAHLFRLTTFLSEISPGVLTVFIFTA